MTTPSRFDASILEVLGRVREVRIETTSIDGPRSHRTIIWIVTAGDQAYVRSVDGTSARWYREAVRRPDVVLHAAGAAIPVTAVPANDPDTVEQVSDAFWAKYGKVSQSSTESMVQPHTLETTLRLNPRDTES
jgi:hypothetical protein